MAKITSAKSFRYKVRIKSAMMSGSSPTTVLNLDGKVEPYVQTGGNVSKAPTPKMGMMFNSGSAASFMPQNVGKSGRVTPTMGQR